MKHTPYTDNYVEEIHLSLSFLNNVEDPALIYFAGAEDILNLMQNNIDRLEKIDMDNLKSEFWDLSNDFEYPKRLRNIYSVKFSELINWKGSIDIVKVDLTAPQDALISFVKRHDAKGIKISFIDSMEILRRYLLIVSTLSLILSQLKSLLEQCDALAGDNDNSPTNNQSIASSYHLVSKRKTDFIKILSAMYDVKMFADAEGKPITNKQKMMEAFGGFLGEDFSKYSASLSQSKDNAEEVFMKPFKDIEKEAKRYFMGNERK